jgi:hypothetical protein
METLALAVELGDLAAKSAEREESLDAKREAKRLVEEHPEAEISVEEVAEVLEEEQAAAAEAEKERADPSSDVDLSYPYPTD